MPRARWGIVPVVVCALAVGGCGSGEKPDTTPRVSGVAADALVAQLERARLTAAAHDLAGTKAALDGFRGQVARLRRAGALSDATARALRTGAARALARATSDIATVVQPQPAPATTRTPAPPAPAKAGKHLEKKHGKGAHKDKHGDEGGD